MMKAPDENGLHALLVKHLDTITLRVQLHVAQGSTLMVTGPSGAGKTTLLRCLAGLERIDQGMIVFNEECWEETGAKRFISPRFRQLGFLTQDYGLFPHMNLAENIRFVLPAGVDPFSHLQAMGIAHLADKYPYQVSGGERQRAALCQTLAREPRLLLLDEPFSALDLENRMLLRERLAQEQERTGLTVIQVTHDLTEVLGSSTQVLSLRQGQEDKAWLQRQRDVLMRDLDRCTHHMLAISA